MIYEYCSATQTYEDKILILECKLSYCVDIMTLPEHLIKAINFLLCTLL